MGVKCVLVCREIQTWLLSGGDPWDLWCNVSEVMIQQNSLQKTERSDEEIQTPLVKHYQSTETWQIYERGQSLCSIQYRYQGANSKVLENE